jgi:hypothetical protein
MLIFLIVSWVFPPPYVNQFLEPKTYTRESTPDSPASSAKVDAGTESQVPFYELPVEQQIEEASMIAMARYEEGEGGARRAVITEILKKAPETVSYYEVGDEHPMSSYMQKSDGFHGDGLIIFFTGSPATMSLSVTFDGERIRGLGDIPLALFREKCSE